MISASPAIKTAILVTLVNHQQTEEQAREYLDELAFLAKTAGIRAIKSFVQKLDHPDPRTFTGKGKTEEIRTFRLSSDADAVIFDDDLSPSQLRNLEKMMDCQIYDRSLLILEIFLNRAKTSQAKTQVELARYQYLLPRLTRMWTHLERQRGGTGTRGGAGEKEIETDRRAIRNQIAILRKKLDKIDRQNSTRRKARESIVRVALIGYTNAGKSTLMTLLSKSQAFAENRLFATVDSLVRKVVIRDIPFLLSDTVGFIRKLPHHLIESFKSTLDEVREADILLHIIDVSHPGYEEQEQVVGQTLSDIGIKDKLLIKVYNKTDLLIRNRKTEDPLTVDHEVEEFYYGRNREGSIYISALEKRNLEKFRELIFEEVKKKHLLIFPNYLKTEVY